MKTGSKALNIGIWVTIALLTILIALVTIWASRQPNLDSIWGE